MANCVADTVEVVVQINGKLRAKFTVSADNLADTDKLTELALADPNVQKFLPSSPKKVIIPKNAHLINFVV